MRFSGKKVLITGGSGAMGQRISAMIAAQGGEIVAGSAEQFAAFLPGDAAAFARLVKEANVRID